MGRADGESQIRTPYKRWFPMRSICLPIALAALAACDNPPTEYTTPLVVSGPAISAKTDADPNHTTQLKGDEEVPARDTKATGNAVYHISSDGNSVEYKVIVANINNVFMSHIHIGPPGVAGPIAVWLYPSTAQVPGTPGGGPINGVIASGTFTAADLTAASGAWDGTWASLLAAIRSGGAYTNVHTNDGVDPANTGPGDFPGGEIRGQFKGGN
jgi:hypothetical protein